jgi:hypothetical protein
MKQIMDTLMEFRKSAHMHQDKIQLTGEKTEFINALKEQRFTESVFRVVIVPHITVVPSSNLVSLFLSQGVHDFAKEGGGSQPMATLITVEAM